MYLINQMDCTTIARQATTTLSRGVPARRVPRRAEWDLPGGLHNSKLINYIALIKYTAQTYF